MPLLGILLWEQKWTKATLIHYVTHQNLPLKFILINILAFILVISVIVKIDIAIVISMITELYTNGNVHEINAKFKTPNSPASEFLLKSVHTVWLFYSWCPV